MGSYSLESSTNNVNFSYIVQIYVDISVLTCSDLHLMRFMGDLLDKHVEIKDLYHIVVQWLSYLPHSHTS